MMFISDRLERQHHRAEGEEQQQERDRRRRSSAIQRQPVGEAVHLVDVGGGPAADEHLGAGRRRQLAQRARPRPGPASPVGSPVVGDGDAATTCPRLAVTWRRSRPAPRRPGRRTPAPPRPAPPETSTSDRGDAAAGELGGDPLGDHPARRPPGSTRSSKPPNCDPQERRGQRRAAPRDRDEVQHRTAHHAAGQPGPAAAARRAGRRGRRRHGSGTRTRVDPRAEHGQQRRQRGQRREHGRPAPPPSRRSAIDLRNTSGRSAGWTARAPRSSPETSTVRPAVAIVRGDRLGVSWPAASSSRNRLTTNSA